ncbi:MAG: (Fe-S)-binding protein [Campylobacterales bacterium]|nr:(Fe-S)-binding protein [Campylobacterales bacterium]
MKVGLFIPCYVDQFFPDVALSTLKILQKIGLDVGYPMDQTCCGQPLYNSGCKNDTKPLAKKFVKLFEPFDYIVAPSGSCVSMVKHNYTKLDPSYEKTASKVYELVEFLHDIVGIDKLKTILHPQFDYKLGIHHSCHALRDLQLSSCSELHTASYSKFLSILSLVESIQISQTKRVDECCGFGGTFSINEPHISTLMGQNRIQEHLDNGVEYITAVDSSCLMHLQGLIDKNNQSLQTIHIAQILGSNL